MSEPDKKKPLGILLTMWKKYTAKVIKRRFGEAVDPDKIDRYLDGVIEKRVQNPKCYWVNNYRQAVLTTDLITAVESIFQKGLIIGGASVTYLQHHLCKNPFRDFILMLRFRRNDEKKERKKYDRVKEFAGWSRWNRKQNNTKIVSNSLYGVLGYAKFIFYNVFLAESITRMGRTIIADAAVGFEDFLCDNACIATESELFEYVSNIIDDYEEQYAGYNFAIFGVDVTVDAVMERLTKKCEFEVSMETSRNLQGILAKLPFGALFLLYYRNNFMEFNRIPVIKQKIMKIVQGIPNLMLPELSKIEDPEIRSETEDLWKFYEMAVYNCHPVYDNVRKMMYGTRKAVLYIDTDSNFISLARWVRQIKEEFFEGAIPQQDEKQFVFVCSNVLTIYLTIVVDRNLKDFAKRCGISDEWAQYLSMKNEFFFWRILFGDVKKRYIDLQMIQEGAILNDGDGIPEIKGYDFRKFNTKASVREYYTDMCLNKILRPETINLSEILGDCQRLKVTIRKSMLAGEATYLKQANVSSPEHYVDPFRISGIKGVLLWNALMPEHVIDLPAEVDLIPIRNLHSKKHRVYFQEKFPEMYQRLEKEIINNRNPQIANMELNIIAKPRIDGFEIPDWLMDIMDTAKIVNSTIKLIHPIMDSLGAKISRPTKNREFLTNLVDL